MRQEEMLHQIQEEKMKLLKQEDMIRSRQQDRLTQVRAEKALLEKQETMLKLREEQLLQERKRQERLREEAITLRRQEEEIRRRQEEIAQELLKGANNVMGVRDTQVFKASSSSGVSSSAGAANTAAASRKPHFSDSVIDKSVVDVQQLNSSDWSSSDAESLIPPVKESKHHLKKSIQDMTTYLEANENYDSNPFSILNPGLEVDQSSLQEVTGSSEDTDTMEEEDCYECKVEVKQQNTHVPTSVRTIETVIDVPGWAPVTPYLNVSEASKEEISEHHPASQQYKNKAGIVTSPESSVITSTNMMTTPDSSISLQSQLSMGDFSSCPPSPLPPIPPLPKDPKDLMEVHFQTVQPEVPPRDDSFNITAVYSSDAHSIFTDQTITSQAPGQRKSLIETNYITIPANSNPDPQLSPRLGGPGSAFRPYASSENLFDMSCFPGAAKPPISTTQNGHNNNNGHSVEKTSKRHSTSSMKPAKKFVESDDDFFKPRAQKPLRAPIMSTTDTEPEMKEFNLGPIGGEKKGKKHQKTFYSTSETEEEYQAYLKSKPKWHGKGGHKDSWDPLQIASPPQIVQKPVGVVQKPKPQAKQVTRIERGMDYSAAFVGNMPDDQFEELYLSGQKGRQKMTQSSNSLAPPDNQERIQKSDSIIEMRPKDSLVTAGDRIQKSNSVIEVIPSPMQKLQIPANNQMFQLSNSNSMTQQQQPPMAASKSNSMLQVPQVSSPPDSEDQTTPQAPRRQFLPNQVSIDSMDSLTEPDDTNENLAPQLKSNKEDPETKKKKEIHKNLMSEALKKVELKTNQKKNFSQLSRTNPTLAALDIVTRKELKMEELEIKQEQEILRNRNRSGSSKVEDVNKNISGVNQNVLQSFRQQSLLRAPSLSSDGDSKVKDRLVKGESKQESDNSHPEPEPVVVLKRQPRILDNNEIQARQSMERQRAAEGKSTPIIEMRSGLMSPKGNEAPPIFSKKAEKNVLDRNVENDLGNKDKVINESEENIALKKSQNRKESSLVKASEKVSAAQQKMQNSEQKQSAKQMLQGVVQVKPKKSEPLKAKPDDDKVPREDSQGGLKKTSTEENNNNIASVRKAAEKYETKNVLSDSSSATNLNSHLRLRSKSISNSRKDQFEEGGASNKGPGKVNLPWAVKSPPVLRKKDASKNKGYALQMSKSSDSITAAKLLAKARAENNNAPGGLRINQNYSKSIEKQIDVYSKTKEEIRMILSLAKSGSVNDRIELFSNLVNADNAPKPNPEATAERIRREIEEAKASAQDTVSDTEIEFQEPVEARVKPLKLSMKPKLIDASDNKHAKEKPTLRINQSANNGQNREQRKSIEDLPCVQSKISNYLSAADETTSLNQLEARPRPILKNSDKERSRSPRKKTPKLVSDHYLTPETNFQIYTQSATDMSANEEEEAEAAQKKVSQRKKSVPAKLPSQDPGPDLLRVPPKEALDRRPGLTKSKSFASSGQFEGSIESDLVTSKKLTMLSFFSGDEVKPKSIMKQPGGRTKSKRTSVPSLTDEVLADEDLIDIDAEFESLLTQTFEQESKGANQTKEGKDRGCVSESRYSGGGGGGSAGQQAGKAGSRGGSGSAQSHHLLHSHQQQQQLSSVKRGNEFSNEPNRLRNSKQRGGGQTFAGNSDVAAASGSASFLCDPQLSSDMQQINEHIKAGFDPVAALPQSSSRRRGLSGTPPASHAHSPSPTQSEYDTADPWDDY